MTEIKKNKIWGALSTVDNIERYREYPFFFANSDHCLVISDTQPIGMIEMTEEFLLRFKSDDWAWIQSVISRVQQAQIEQYPDEAEALIESTQDFIQKFRDELESWRTKNASGDKKQ